MELIQKAIVVLAVAYMIMGVVRVVFKAAPLQKLLNITGSKRRLGSRAEKFFIASGLLEILVGVLLLVFSERASFLVARLL